MRPKSRNICKVFGIRFFRVFVFISGTSKYDFLVPEKIRVLPVSKTCNGVVVGFGAHSARFGRLLAGGAVRSTAAADADRGGGAGDL